MAALHRDLVLRPRWQEVTSIPTNPLQQKMLAVMYLVAAVALLTYCLRMYSKINSKQLGTEDWFMTAAVAFAIALDSSSYVYFKYNYSGFPQAQIPSQDPTPGLFWTFIVGLLYNPTLALVKSSVLFFMLRIAGHKKGVWWSCHVLNVFNLSLMVATFLVVLFQTIPISAYWDTSIKAERTINAGLFAISTAILTIVTDILVLAIPIYTFIGLKVNLPTRIGIIFIFMASGVVTVIGILRIVAFKHFFFDQETYDFSNTWGPSYSTIEPNVAIIAACVPSLTPLLRRWLPRVFGSSSAKRSSNGMKYKSASSGSASRSMQLHNMGRTRAEVRGGLTREDSQEDMIVPDGIIKTTRVSRPFSVSRSGLLPVADMRQVNVSYANTNKPERDSEDATRIHRLETHEHGSIV